MPVVVLTAADGSTLAFDAVVEEGHASPAEATSFPVEEGGDASDHIRLGPKTLTIRGIMGEFPLSFFAGFPATDQRPQRAHDELLRMQALRQPMTVSTSLRRYESMALLGVSATRDGRVVLDSTCNFRQIRTVASATVAAPKVSTSTPTAQPTKKDGPKTPESIPTDNSFAASILDVATKGAASLRRGNEGNAAINILLGNR